MFAIIAVAYTLASKLDRWWISSPMVFVAAAAGLMFGAVTRGRVQTPGRFTETLGLSASFLVWTIFGAIFVGDLLTHQLAAESVIYAIVSLTLIRMVPVAIALAGTHLRPANVAFTGSFGPRGLASVVFTLIAIQDFEHSGAEAILVEAATWTILLSVVLHGVSASAIAARSEPPSRWRATCRRRRRRASLLSGSTT